MKKLFALVLLLCSLLSLTACAGEQTKTIYLLETVDCQLIQADMDRSYRAEANIYDKNGAMTGRKTTDSQGFSMEWTVQTDEYGRVVQMAGTDRYGTQHTWQYTYDAWGNVQTLSKIVGSHRVNYEVNTWDSQGRILTREFWINDDMTKTEYIYDGDRLEKQVTYSGDQEVSKVLYNYDSQGRLKRVVYYTGKALTRGTDYSYSEDGRTTYIEDSAKKSRTEQTHDENGNLVRSVVYNKDGKVLETYEYTYRAVKIPADWPRKTEQ